MILLFIFFFNDTATTEIYTLSLHDALPIYEPSLREAFIRTLTPRNFFPSASSSRLLTGNFTACEELEGRLAEMFGTESALIFNSGYHANTGILPAVSDAQTLILARSEERRVGKECRSRWSP